MDGTMRAVAFVLSILGWVGCAGSPPRVAPVHEPSQLTKSKDFDDTEITADSDGGAISSPREEPEVLSREPEISALSLDEKKILKVALTTRDEATAIDQISPILSSHPREIVALNSLAMFYYRIEKWDMATLILQRALKVDADHPSLLNNLGLVLLKQGELRQALALFRKGHELASDNGVITRNLATVYLDNRDYEKALPLWESLYDRRVKEAMNDSALLVNYALCLAGTGKAKTGLKVLRASPNQNDILIIFNQGAIMIEQLGEYDEGLKLLNIAHGLNPDSDILKKMTLLEAFAKERQK